MFEEWIYVQTNQVLARREVHFFPKSKSLQSYGYMSFKGGRGEFGHPTYKEAVGRIGTLLDVTKKFIGSMRAGWQVTIRMDDNGQDYTGDVFSVSNEPDDASVRGIAPLLDLQAARNKWLGKTLWLKLPNLSTYDSAPRSDYPIHLDHVHNSLLAYLTNPDSKIDKDDSEYVFMP